MEEGACLVMKNIGKPCTGKPYARFDEGGQATVTMIRLLRHRQTKGVETDRLDLPSIIPAFYSTLTPRPFVEDAIARAAASVFKFAVLVLAQGRCDS